MKKCLGALAAFFISAPALSKPSSEWSLNLESTLTSTMYAEVQEGTNQNLNQLELVPVYRWKYRDAWRFYAKPTLVLNPDNKSEEERTFFDLSETYLRYQTDTFSLQAGNLIYAWGVTDGYNPLDIINSRQYFDPLHSRKLGATSISFSQSGEIWDYELVLIPKNQGSQLPGVQSRWLPRRIYVPETQDNNLVLLLPKNLNYHYSSRTDLDAALDNNFALRVQRRGSWLDLALSLYEGVATFPLVQPEVTGNIVQVSPKTVIAVDPDITLHTKNYRVRQGGLASVINMETFLIKFATSYTQSLGTDPLLPGWTQESVLGLERTFNLGTDGILIAVLQHSMISSERNHDSNLSMTEIFRRGWMLGGRLSWKEVWNVSALTLYDSLRGSHFEELSLARRIHDTWLVSLTADFIQGSQDSPLGVYENNDSFRLSVSRSF